MHIGANHSLADVSSAGIIAAVPQLPDDNSTRHVRQMGGAVPAEARARVKMALAVSPVTSTF
jgi:hypothetical protein